MKSRIRIMGRLSVVLLICVLLGQGAWMYRVREMKVDEFRKTADYVLQDIIQIFLDNQAPFVGNTIIQKKGLKLIQWRNILV